jgi:hypothetical protein
MTNGEFVKVLQIRQVRQEFYSGSGLREESAPSLLTSIGNTPLIQIHRMARHLKGVQIFAKAEWS